MKSHPLLRQPKNKMKKQYLEQKHLAAAPSQLLDIPKGQQANQKKVTSNLILYSNQRARCTGTFRSTIQVKQLKDKTLPMMIMPTFPAWTT
jgi:hypothetical protein